MNSNEHYLDYNATAPLLPEVWEAMQTVQATSYGNPSSPHGPGRRARNRLEEARRQLASLLGVEYQELCFTSGGSESNNAILRQFLQADKPNHWILSPLEHPSLLETAQHLAEQGRASLDLLPVDRGGRVLPEALPELIRPETCLVSVMGANNETGVIQPIAELQAIAQQHGIPLHTDSVQILGRVPVSWQELGVNYATATAHKLGGPRGIGLLYVREGSAFTPLITGGKQERVRRAGTESVALAVGFAAALAWVLEQQPQLSERLQSFQQQVLERLQTVEGFFLNGDPQFLLPNTLNVGFQGLSAETLLISLDLDGVAVSTGSACSSGALEPSPVLLAMGLTPTEARSCLRLSWGWQTTQADIDA
ncbi:MAG: cysteine desulfurase family protein, partial [Aquiluna sp.]